MAHRGPFHAWMVQGLSACHGAPMTQPQRNLALVKSDVVGFLGTIRDGTVQRLKTDDRFKRLAEVVFAYWQAKLNHPHAWIDAKREKRIITRLRECGGDWGLLCYAVDGALRDAYIMGRDPNAQRKYDGISTIFRDLEQVERLAELCPRYRAGESHPLVVKYQQTTDTPADTDNPPAATHNPSHLELTAKRT